MRTPIQLAWLAAACLGWPTTTHAQSSPLIREGSIGKQVTPATTAPKAADPATKFADVPFDTWPKHRFVFLAQPTGLQKYGYQIGVDGERFPYAQYVGRVAVVTRVAHGTLDRVDFAMADDGSTHSAYAVHGVVRNWGPVEDIERARERWLNKTLWLSSKELLTYDAASDAYHSIKLAHRFTPVEVTSIVGGSDEATPIRFIVRTAQGDEGFADVHLSNTNVSRRLHPYNTFDEIFFKTDPKATHKWPSHVWSAIDAGDVEVGMTAEQAKLAWGEPEDINTTDTAEHFVEQWVYSNNRYLYLDNGRVTGSQE